MIRAAADQKGQLAKPGPQVVTAIRALTVLRAKQERGALTVDPVDRGWWARMAIPGLQAAAAIQALS